MEDEKDRMSRGWGHSVKVKEKRKAKRSAKKNKISKSREIQVKYKR